jgi:hypothetical protein
VHGEARRRRQRRDAAAGDVERDGVDVDAGDDAQLLVFVVFYIM